MCRMLREAGFESAEALEAWDHPLNRQDRQARAVQQHVQFVTPCSPALNSWHRRYYIAKP